MNPIVNPLFFYFASVADSLCCVIGIFGTISLGVLAIEALICLIEYISYEGDVEDVCVFSTSKKVVKWAMISSIILWTIFIFVPSKEVLIEMEVAKYATPDNIKSVITEIVSTVKEMIK
jgi:hypothetical protein